MILFYLIIIVIKINNKKRTKIYLYYPNKKTKLKKILQILDNYKLLDILFCVI